VRPLLAASAIVLDTASRVLLIRENYGRHRFGPPGGRVEQGEAPWDAAVRETREETGLEVAARQLIGVYLVESDPPLLNFAFSCSVEAGEPSLPHTGEIAEIGWFDPLELPSPLTNSGPHAIADGAAGRRGVFRTVPKVT
jgi:8-oxo-dGTP diphosphatase